MEEEEAEGAVLPIKSIQDVTFWTVLCKKDLWPCFISIFFALFSLMGITATLTAHLVQDYEFDATIAYYLFAVWSSGHIIGSFSVTCMIPCTRVIIRVALAMHMVGLLMAGPSNLAHSWG